MRKFTFILFATLLVSKIAYSQSCDCESNFNWVKKTFEENDAGFTYAIETKGRALYENHNQLILEKIKKAKTSAECMPILYEWLTFFRSGHIAIRPIQKPGAANTPQPEVNKIGIIEKYRTWDSVKIDLPAFEHYLTTKKTVDYEGIWDFPPYKIGIKKEGGSYVGFIVQGDEVYWRKGQVKLRITPQEDGAKTTYYMQDHSVSESNTAQLIGKNHLEIGYFRVLKRSSPKLEDEQGILDYLKLDNARKPYVDQVNPTTLLFRIPSFSHTEKQSIDSAIRANRSRIHQTENLIIDIRNGTGGSDASYSRIIPLLYTNPIREIGVEFYSTPLNNQRMLEFANNPASYNLDEETQKWAKESYDKLQKNLGKFVSLNKEAVSVRTFDTIHPYPKNVGIIMENNGSTDEQFLLAAKQSKKVKLFGVTSMGALDISNMYFIPSPCKEFELGYCLSKSMRIPGMAIDGKGVQPDYYLDKTIPKYTWVDYVTSVLNAR